MNTIDEQAIARRAAAARKLPEAALATRMVGTTIDLTLDALATQFPAPINPHGIYHDPARVQAVLSDIAVALKVALLKMQATEWPRPSDYEEI